MDDPKLEDDDDDASVELHLAPYVRNLRSVLSYSGGWPKGATKVFDFLYLGGEDEARNVDLLNKLGITHVVNCAESYVTTGRRFYDGRKPPSTVTSYVGFAAEDDPGYDIMQHFDVAFAAIEEARTRGGKAFIHCIMGINRSGALAVAYAMVHREWGPSTAARHVKDARKLLLSNEGFLFQLVRFAHRRGFLSRDGSLVAS